MTLHVLVTNTVRRWEVNVIAYQLGSLYKSSSVLWSDVVRETE